MPMHCRACDAGLGTTNDELCGMCLAAARSCLPTELRTKLTLRDHEDRLLRMVGAELSGGVGECIASI